jgi:dynein light intermediate chain 1
MTNSTTSSIGIPATSSILPTTGASLPPMDGGGQQGGPSHEVLANFFQSLLSKKSSSGASPPTSVLGSREGESDITSVPSRGRRPTISRKDVHKELDRLRQFSNKS